MPTKAQGNVTTDHEEIREWVESRGGHPACVMGTGGKGDTGLLRIDFPGFSGEGKLQEISWDEFFEKFDENNLAFLHQDKTADGKPSRFSKLVSRDQAESSGRSGAAKHRAPAKKKTAARATGTAKKTAQSRSRKSPVKATPGGRSGRKSTTGRSSRSR